MANRYPRKMPGSVGSSSSPMSINNMNLPGAWPPEPADPIVSASMPPLAAHSARRPVVPIHRTRSRLSLVTGPSGTQRSHLSTVEANAVRSTSDGRSNSSDHPYLSPNPRRTESERMKTEEALQDTTSPIPQPFLEVHAPPKKVSKAKDGHWTKKEVKQFQKKLENLYQKQHEAEEQAATNPLDIQVILEAHTGLEQRAFDLTARQSRFHEKSRMLASMEATTGAYTNRKATAELQQITKGMQNMRISHVGREVSPPPVRPEILASHSVDPRNQAERFNTTCTLPKPTNKNVVFATRRSLLDFDTKMNDGTRSKGAASRKNTKEVNYSRTHRDTSTCRDATAIRTIEEVDRARKMQELSEQFSQHMELTPDALVPLKPYLQGSQKDEPGTASSKGTKAGASQPSKRVHFHPLDAISLPEPLHLDPVSTAAAVRDVDMDLYEPLPPRASSPSAGVFTDIPLSSPLHQTGLESDFVEVDMGEVDGLEWEVINA